MKKNVAGQKVGVQMVSATDGSAFTGSVTVAVTLDAGTQATGTVGSGACTHEGNGYHTYAPAQAETNGDLVAFTFTGTGAVPATVQIYTSFPQTGDNYARIGAPVGASISADIAAVQSDTDNIQTRIPAALVSGRMDASVGAYQTGLTPLQPTTAGRTLDVTATGAAGVDWGNVENPTTVVGLSGTTVKTATDVATDTAAIKAKTDNLPASPAATGDAMTLTSAYDAAKTAADATAVASSFTSVLSKLLKYVQLMVRKDAAIATDNATELTAINANGGTGAGSFDNTTEAVQAIRDRGDAAWVTATGFSTLDAAGVRTAVGLASANLDTQLAAKAEPGDAMALTADALDAASLAASAGTEIAAAVQTSAATTPLPSDVKKINATTITGTGVLGDEFGPA